jgi:hypothetical protein
MRPRLSVTSPTYPLESTWFSGGLLFPGDFNGDGFTDFLLHYPVTGAYYVVTATGSGFSYKQGGSSTGWTPLIADLNADRKDDLFMHSPTTGAWLEVLSDGVGGFVYAGGQTWPLGWQIHFTDVNGDGRADVVLYDSIRGVWYQARNFVNGAFTYSTGTWAPGLTIVTRQPRR